MSQQTFRRVENRSRLSSASLPVDAVRQRANKVLLRRLHDVFAHPVKLGGVVDATVELGTGVGKFYRGGRKTKTRNVDDGRQTKVQVRNDERRKTHAARCEGLTSASSASPASLHRLQRRKNPSRWAQSENAVVFSVFARSSQGGDAPRGSASRLLRLCWDDAGSLVLAGLFLARLSATLSSHRHRQEDIRETDGAAIGLLV